MKLLTERRAEFVYDVARLAAIASGAPVIPVPWQEREQAFRDQFLKVIERQTGPQRSSSPEELHGSWMQACFAMGWQFGPVYSREAKTHPDLVPYADLGQLERDKDAVFVALCEIARRWVYDLGEPTPSPASTLCGSEEDDEDSYRRRVASEDAHAPVCEVCNRPATSPVHATSLDGLIGPTHGFQAKREDAHAPVRTWAERVADVEARAERALCPACAGLGVCAGCDGTGRDERDAT